MNWDMGTKDDKKQLNFFEEGRSVVQIKVSVPAAREALQTFARDRVSALKTLKRDVRRAVSEVFNDLMNLEMSVYLGGADQAGNKRNGVRRRSYYLKGVGQLDVEVPRDRAGGFDSVIIPRHERMDPAAREDLALLHLAGLSGRTLAMISRRILGVDISKSTISESLSLLKPHAEHWLTRPITEPYWALYVDGTNFKVQRRGSTEREPSLIVLGVNERHHRSVLAVEPGTRDNVESWRAVFRELKRRGLDANAVQIGIMDGLPGLERLFAEEFPNAVTARCWKHAKGNALAKAPARFRPLLDKQLTAVMYAQSEADARRLFNDLKTALGDDMPRAVTCIEKDLDSLLTHYRFERRFWRALKTTNPIERVNKELKRRTRSMETLGEGTLMTVVAFTALRLEMGWRQHAIDSKVFDNLEKSGTRRMSKHNTVELAVKELQDTVH